MKLPSLFRRTPFRLTLLFLALFAAAASAVLAWVYVVSASEARQAAEASVRAEVEVLAGIHRERGDNALNAALIERVSRGGSYLYVLSDRTGAIKTANISQSPFDPASAGDDPRWDDFRVPDVDEDGRVQMRQAIGVETPLGPNDLLFVGQDIGDIEDYLARLTQALWAAMAMVLILGLVGGLIISRNVERGCSGGRSQGAGRGARAR